MRLRRCLLLLAALITSIIVGGCSKKKPEAVFLIVVDTLRQDRLSSYGQDFFITPHADSLAADGVLFKNAFSAASWTIPGMGSIMTSLYPTQLGLVEQEPAAGQTIGWHERRDQQSHTLSLEENTLAEIMREAGYTTAAFVNQPGLNAGQGFAQGFDDYYYPRDEVTIDKLTPETVMEYQKWPPFLKNAREIDELLVDRFEGWLEERGGDKMFVWIHLLTPHRPYLPPPWATPRVASKKGRFARPEGIDGYDGEVISVDETLGRILAAIDSRFARDRSVVLFTSDHGEAFGEHGMTEHGHTLHGEVVRVPLIVRAPGAPAGQRVDASVSTIDILPTLLDLAGAGDLTPADIEGASLAPLFDEPGADRDVYSEGMLYGTTERALLVNGYKVMLDQPSGTFQMFNCMLDPAETINVKATKPALADSIYASLQKLHQRLSADFERRAGTGVPQEKRVQFQKAMESLGYVEGGGDSVVTPPPVDPHAGHQH